MITTHASDNRTRRIRNSKSNNKNQYKSQMLIKMNMKTFCGYPSEFSSLFPPFFIQSTPMLCLSWYFIWRLHHTPWTIMHVISMLYERMACNNKSCLIMSHPISELFPFEGISLYVTYFVVFLYVCSQAFQEVTPDQIWSLLMLKKSISFCFLWKQKQNLS